MNEVKVKIFPTIKYCKSSTGVPYIITEFLDKLVGGKGGKDYKKVEHVLRLIDGKHPSIMADQSISYYEAVCYRKKYIEPLADTDGILEVRVDSASKHFRLLGFYDEKKDLVLTSGFLKQDDDDYKREKNKAKERRKAYLSCPEN